MGFQSIRPSLVDDNITFSMDVLVIIRRGITPITIVFTQWSLGCMTSAARWSPVPLRVRFIGSSAEVSDFTLLGVPALGFVFNMTTGNLRHSHVWLRFPPMIERWLISPAQHQLHHSLDEEHYGSNYGTWLAIWDRMVGSLVVSTEVAPLRYGIPSDERNHGDDLLSAWFGPFRAMFSRSSLAAGVGLVALASSARADEPVTSSDKDDWSGFGEEIIVDGDQEKPREAGSAYVVEESDLELFEYDDVERILLQVPGVSTRGEDGFGLRPNIGIRGANSDRSAKVTLMEDGVLLAPAPYAAPAAYYFPMSTRFVGLEVFKGAAATRYGPNTVGGAVNVLTREIPDRLTAYSDVSIGLRRYRRMPGRDCSTHALDCSSRGCTCRLLALRSLIQAGRLDLIVPSS